MYKIHTFFLIILSITYILRLTCYSERIQYIITEHPVVSWYDRKYIKYVNFTSARHGRSDPFYYVGCNIDMRYESNNNISLHYYVYEFLSNTYRRGFVELHFKLCDLIEKDLVIGAALRQGPFKKPCPYPAGVYNLSNMTIPLKQVPKHFPFKKGRVYINMTRTATGAPIGQFHIDLEIKEGHVKVRNWVD